MKNPKKNRSSTVRKDDRAWIHCLKCGEKFDLKKCPGYINWGKIWLNPLRTKLPIFTPKELKTILDFVQNDAKNRPNRITKTTELMVLLLARGLTPVELLGLNIEDLPYSHGEPCIFIRKVRKLCYGYGVPREIYLFDDSLETKITEYVQKYRKGAKPKDPLFVSRSRKRTSSGVLGNKLYGSGCKYPGGKPKLGGSPNIGLSQKLGINPLLAYMFRRTEIYQLAGRINPDTAAEKMRLQSKTRVGTLKIFIRKCCKGNYSEVRLKDLVTLIYNANARERIKLPDHTGHWSKGQSKKFKFFRLLLNWPIYQDALSVLPDLDHHRINKDYKKEKLQEF